jgi:hypothetical protein
MNATEDRYQAALDGQHEQKEAAMKLLTAVIAAALLLAAPARADEDCDAVVKALEDAQLVSTKTLDQTKVTHQGCDLDAFGKRRVLLPRECIRGKPRRRVLRHRRK